MSTLFRSTLMHCPNLSERGVDAMFAVALGEDEPSSHQIKKLCRLGYVERRRRDDGSHGSEITPEGWASVEFHARKILEAP